jgi:hypothetical protein
VQGDDDDGNGASHTVLEGRLVNLDVTSPAATVALTLMYLKVFASPCKPPSLRIQLILGLSYDSPAPGVTHPCTN